MQDETGSPESLATDRENKNRPRFYTTKYQEECEIKSREVVSAKNKFNPLSFVEESFNQLVSWFHQKETLKEVTANQTNQGTSDSENFHEGDSFSCRQSRSRS